jgi:hypothetical protein
MTHIFCTVVNLYGEREFNDKSKGKLEETLFEVLLKVAEL